MRIDGKKLQREGEEEEEEISYFPIPGTKIPDRYNLREERFNFAHRFRGF